MKETTKTVPPMKTGPSYTEQEKKERKFLVWAILCTLAFVMTVQATFIYFTQDKGVNPNRCDVDTLWVLPAESCPNDGGKWHVCKTLNIDTLHSEIPAEQLAKYYIALQQQYINDKKKKP